MILVCAPGRKYFDQEPEWGEIPSIESEIEIIKKFNSEVIGLALNTEGLTSEEAVQKFITALKITVHED